MPFNASVWIFGRSSYKYCKATGVTSIFWNCLADSLTMFLGSDELQSRFMMRNLFIFISFKKVFAFLFLFIYINANINFGITQPFTRSISDRNRNFCKVVLRKNFPNWLWQTTAEANSLVCSRGWQFQFTTL